MASIKKQAAPITSRPGVRNERGRSGRPRNLILTEAISRPSRHNRPSRVHRGGESPGGTQQRGVMPAGPSASERADGLAGRPANGAEETHIRAYASRREAGRARAPDPADAPRSITRGNGRDPRRYVVAAPQRRVSQRRGRPAGTSGVSKPGAPTVEGGRRRAEIPGCERKNPTRAMSDATHWRVRCTYPDVPRK